MRGLLAALIFMVPCIAIADADTPEESMLSNAPPGTLPALSPLASGILGGALCNDNVHPDVGAAFLRDKLGPSATFDLKAVVQVIWFATVQRMLQEQLGSIPVGDQDASEYCGTMMRAFGPRGTEIRGLITP